jgi:hypothetical protein
MQLTIPDVVHHSRGTSIVFKYPSRLIEIGFHPK